MEREILSCAFGEESYFERIKDSKDPARIRLKIIEYLTTCKSVSETARKFRVSRQIVRKWEKRYREEGMEGLKDRPKIPKKRRTILTDEITELILKLRHEYGYGPRRIKRALQELYNIKISEHPIYNVLKSNKIQNGNHL